MPRKVESGRKIRRRAGGSAILWALLLAGSVGAPPTAARDADGAEQREIPRTYREAFEQVWTTVRERVPLRERTDVDWEAVGQRYRARLSQVAGPQELERLLSAMLDELGRSHLAIIPAATSTALGGAQGAPPGTGGAPGMTVRVPEDRALVTRVRSGGPAAEAGIAPGFIIEAIEGEPLQPVLRRIADSYAGSTLRDLRLVEAVSARLAGPRGATRRLTVLDGSDQRRSVSLTLGKPRGKLARFGRLPPSPVWVSFGKIGGDIGHLSFNAFLDPPRLMPAFENAVERCRGCRGLILDLRGNRGGIAAMAMGLAGWLVDEPDQHLGVMRTADATVRFAIFPRPHPLTVPLAILVDGLTASTAEILAGGLEDMGRARVFGSRTAGAALASVIHRLPTGHGFQFPVASYRSAAGADLEGQGVTPNEHIVPQRGDLLAGRDPVLEAAVRWIRSRSGAEELIERYLAQAGGRDRIAAIESARMRGTVRVPDLGVEGSLKAWLRTSGHSRVTLEIPGLGVLDQGTLPDLAWESSLMGARIRRGEEKALALHATQIDPLLDWEERYRSVRLEGLEQVGQRRAHRLVLTTPGDTEVTRLIDAETYEPIETRLTLESPMGTITSVTRVLEVGTVDGVRLPVALEEEAAGMRMVVDLESIELNPEIPEGTFTPPEAVRVMAEREESAEPPGGGTE